MTKRFKSMDTEPADQEPGELNGISSVEHQPPDLPIVTQIALPVRDAPYEGSICGSILHPSPCNRPSDIFSLLYHGRLDVFRRSLDINYKEIIHMKNEHGQTVLHVLATHAFPYHWIRLLLMRGCDPCSQDDDGYTAVHYAVERDNVEMLKALTLQFSDQIKIFSVEQLTAIHERCLTALTLREKDGLTPFMLACRQESLRCFDYLLEMNINDVHLQDRFGDTCLHYAVARRNEPLVEKLINRCRADVNAGESVRPSVLDVLQFNRQQQKLFDRTKDDTIEQILLINHASNRHQLRRIVHKRRRSVDEPGSVIDDLACLSVNASTLSQVETAKNHARIALTFERNGDMNNALKCYKRALDSVPNDISDWADYAYHLALIYRVQGEDQAALDLLQQALVLRRRFENESEQIQLLQQTIDSMPKLA